MTKYLAAYVAATLLTLTPDVLWLGLLASCLASMSGRLALDRF